MFVLCCTGGFCGFWDEKVLVCQMASNVGGYCGLNLLLVILSDEGTGSWDNKVIRNTHLLSLVSRNKNAQRNKNIRKDEEEVIVKDLFLAVVGGGRRPIDSPKITALWWT